MPYEEAGLWGLFHVAPAHAREAGLRRLPRARGGGGRRRSGGFPVALSIVVGAVLGAGSVYVLARRRRVWRLSRL
jgi:hypothetical protein